MIQRQLHRLLLPALAFLLPALGGCPLPIAHTETASQPVSGVYRRSDGTPIANAWVRLAIAGRDNHCMHYALTTLTDSAGRFHFPAIQKHYKVMWFVPNLDRAEPGYVICLEQADTLQEAYLGQGSIKNEVLPEAISCVQWDRGFGLHISCSGNVERSITTGGQWRSDDGVGWYRVVLDEEDVSRWAHPRILLQWMTAEAQGRDSVIRTAELQVDHSIWTVYDPEIFLEDGRWYLTLGGLRHTLMDGAKSSHVQFRLGPPGEALTVQPY